MDAKAASERMGGGRAAAIYRSIFDAVVDQRLPPGAQRIGVPCAAGRSVSRRAVTASVGPVASGEASGGTARFDTPSAARAHRAHLTPPRSTRSQARQPPAPKMP